MKPGRQLRLRDCRAAFRLLGEVSELRADRPAWQRHLIDGLCRLLRASDGGAIVFSPGPPDRPKPRLIASELGGDPHSTSSQAYVHWASNHGLLGGPFLRSAVRARRPLYAKSWTQLPPDRVEGTSFHRDYMKPACVRDCLVGNVRLPAHGWIHGMGLNRCGLTAQPYTPREHQLFRLVVAELGRLFHSGRLNLDPGAAAPDPMAGLTPRQRQIGRLLLAGQSPKQIAFELGLRTDTVYSYCKAMYRRLGVSGRGEFMARFVTPAPADHPAPKPRLSP